MRLCARALAGRPVSPELWRCVGPFGDTEALADLQRVLATGSAIERQAAALALAAPRCQGARVAGAPDLGEAVARGELTWDNLHQAA